MKVTHLLLALLLTGAVSSCSDPVSIGDGFYGVKIKAGEVVSVVEGPGVITKSPFLDHVVVFPKIQNMEIPLSHGEKIVLSVEVTDPKQFYDLAKGNRDALSSYYADKLKGSSLNTATEIVLKRLNKPDTGIVVKVPNTPLEGTR